MKINVTLSSERYGTETFTYKTEAEALEGVIRLYKNCQKHFKIDRVPRTLSVQIGAEK